MKTVRATFTSTIVSMLALSLLTSVAFGDARPIGDYEASSNGVYPVEGILKRSRDCPAGTAFIKNAFPSLTNGPVGSVVPKEETYFINLGSDTVPVTVRIIWDEFNSFAFQIDRGVAHIVGVTSDTNNLLYDYTAAPVSADGGLNSIPDAADVNHLDLCLAAVDDADTQPPTVTISEPSGGTTVTGLVTVKATVTDNVAVETSTVTASINGDSLGVGTATANPDEFSWDWDTTTTQPDSNGNFIVTVSATDTSGNTQTQSVTVAADLEPPTVSISEPSSGTTVNTGLVTVKATVTDNVAVVDSTVTASVNGDSLGTGAPTGNPDEFMWTWDATTAIDGTYTIAVSAFDTSGNEGTDSVTVSLVTPVAACEGLLGNDDPTENQGCNPSGVQNVQVPPDNKLDTCLSNNPQQPECTITEFLLTPDPAKLASNVPPALLAICTGPNVFPDPRVGVNGIPVVAGPLDVFETLGGGTPGELILDEFTFGNPCFAVVKGARNFDLLNAFFWPQDPATGLVIIRTQFAERLDGIGPVAQCYDESANPNLMQAAEATYQDDDKARMKAGTAEVMTNACFNPKRMSSFDFSFNVLNTKEYGFGIDFNSPTGPDDVLDFKFQRADAKFDFLEQALFAAESQLVSPKFSDLTRKFNQARSQFDKRNPAALTRAIEDLQDLLFEVRNGTWILTPDNNPGDVQMRTENLIHRIELIRREVIRLEGP